MARCLHGRIFDVGRIKMDGLLLLPHLDIQNANTISSPITWGFPALTAVLGFVHALERKLNDSEIPVKLGGVGVICHYFEPLIYKNGFENRFCLTRNPLGKDGKSPSIVEEGRAHLQVSFLIETSHDLLKGNENARQNRAEEILEIAQTLRFAGGSIFLKTNKKAKLFSFDDLINDEKESRKLLRSLLPGFSLISREDLLTDTADPLETLLDFSSIYHEPVLSEGEKTTDIEWRIKPKAHSGWIVPIPIGYQAISELYPPGKVINARDPEVPFRFVENIYSLGQWVSPHRIKNLRELLWCWDINAEEGIYRCRNTNQNQIQELSIS